jgi:hypothetical protein
MASTPTTFSARDAAAVWTTSRPTMAVVEIRGAVEASS